MTDTPRTHASWIGRTVFDRHGEKVGDITDVYYDDRTGRPEWITVSTGWFGTKTQFVPIAGSAARGDDVIVDHDKELIKGAPGVDVAGGHLSQAEEDRLYRHYGFDADAPDPGAAYGQRGRADEGFDYYDRRDGGDHGSETTPEAAEVTRSEERLAIEKRRRVAGRARLHKYVVTEDVTVTVPVKKLVARLVVEPASDEAGGRLSGPGVADEEIVLAEERVTIDKRTVARERVRLEVDEVTELHTVDETLRKERIEVEGDVDTDGR